MGDSGKNRAREDIRKAASGGNKTAKKMEKQVNRDEKREGKKRE